MFRAAAIGFAATLLGISVVSARAQEVCTGILQYTGRGAAHDARDNFVAKSLYDRYCQGSVIKNSLTESIAIGAIAYSIPDKFNFAGPSPHEQLNNFCKNYSSGYAAYMQQDMSTPVVIKDAMDAFSRCIELSRKDVFFSPTLVH